ncbi:MAG TPA: hypothetical protein VFP32_02150 [Candidatus Saccharimonadales bacterium]|nr:hypothetical protein [Candidatus Saccharimonadales bacterium]
MKRKDLLTVVGVAVVSGIISLIIANALFSPKRLSLKVPVVEKISGTFPDVKNDSQYNTIFNTNALDPTQPVQIGNNQNQAPFSNSTQ